PRAAAACRAEALLGEGRSRCVSRAHARGLGGQPLPRRRHRTRPGARGGQARPRLLETPLISPPLLAALQASISEAAGGYRIERASPVAGGCIHRCVVLEGGSRRYFAKVNDRTQLDNFAAEADGLAALAASGARVPAPVCRGEAESDAFLVLEYLEMRRGGDYAALGRALARVHAPRGEVLGWARDNDIGAT